MSDIAPDPTADPTADPGRMERGSPAAGSPAPGFTAAVDKARMTREQIAAQAGMSLTDVRRLWRALGFPDSGGDAVYDSDDLVALRLVAESITHGGVDLDTSVRLARALGNTMARLADWEVSTQVAYAESPLRARRDVDQAAGDGRALGSSFEQMLVYAWRRHLAAATSRVEAADTALHDASGTVLTVGFADLVGFTALSNGLDDEALGRLVEAFESDCTDVITSGAGRAVKTLGDSVLFVVEDADAGVDIALCIVEQIGADDSLPDVRVGLSSGAVTSRMGDVYGPPVNRASRLTSVARRNRVIIDAATASALSDTRFETRALPPRPMRGLGVIEPITVRRRWTLPVR